VEGPGEEGPGGELEKMYQCVKHACTAIPGKSHGQVEWTDMARWWEQWWEQLRAHAFNAHALNTLCRIHVPTSQHSQGN